MHTIWKYPIDTRIGRSTIDMPAGAKPICVGLDPEGIPSIWMQVPDTTQLQYPRRIEVWGTGNEIRMDSSFTYVGSFQEKEYMWHVWIGP